MLLLKELCYRWAPGNVFIAASSAFKEIIMTALAVCTAGHSTRLFHHFRVIFSVQEATVKGSFLTNMCCFKAQVNAGLLRG